MATILPHNVKIGCVGQHSNFSATIVNKQTPARGCLESFHTADYMPLLQTNPHVYLLIAHPCISQMNSMVHRPIMQPLFELHHICQNQGFLTVVTWICQI